MTRQQKGFLATLFDMSFSDFVNVKLIRGLYRLIIVITANGTLCAWLIAWSLPGWFGWGIKLTLYVSVPAAALVWLTVTRVILEHLIIIYAIHEKVTTITHNANHDRKDDNRK